MHDVVVTGCGLDALLADVAAQVVTVLQQPPRAEHFAPAPGPRVLAVEVRRIPVSRLAKFAIDVTLMRLEKVNLCRLGISA